jgi:hypothetical protein
VLASVAVFVAAERIRELLFRAPLAPSFTSAVVAALEDGDRAHAEALTRAGGTAWVAETLHARLGPEPSMAEELLAELGYRATRRLYALRVFASLGTATGFLGAISQLIWLMSGDHGLLALKAGLVERIAMERALLCLVTGVAISVFCLVAMGVLKRAAIELVGDVKRAVTRVELALDPPAD